MANDTSDRRNAVRVTDAALLEQLRRNLACKYDLDPSGGVTSPGTRFFRCDPR